MNRPTHVETTLYVAPDVLKDASDDTLAAMLGPIAVDALRRKHKLWQEHADVHPCLDCRVPTSAGIGSYWLAPDELWERVVGDQMIALCPRCFEGRARLLGIAVSWRAVEDDG